MRQQLLHEGPRVHKAMLFKTTPNLAEAEERKCLLACRASPEALHDIREELPHAVRLAAHDSVIDPDLPV